MKAYIGSTNIVKVNAVKEVLEPLGYEVISMNVNSLVDAQPKSDKETITGAKNRAKALPDDGVRIGLEAGVEYLDGTLYLTNWGVLLANDKEFIAGGTRIPLPNEITNLIMNEHYELSEAMEKYFKTKDIKHHNGAIGYFTCDMVKRIDIFTHIVKLLYGEYLYNGGKK